MPRSRRKRRYVARPGQPPSSSAGKSPDVMKAEEENSDLDVNDMLEGEMDSNVYFLTQMKP